MESIQIVLDKKLVQAADRAARQVLENRDREGYSRPQGTDKWEAEAVWPER